MLAERLEVATGLTIGQILLSCTRDTTPHRRPKGRIDRIHTLIGSLSVSGGSSIEATAFAAEAGLEATIGLGGFISGEVFLFTRGLRVAVFLAGAAVEVAAFVFEIARVVREGAGAFAACVVVFVRVEERVVFGLLAMVSSGTAAREGARS